MTVPSKQHALCVVRNPKLRQTLKRTLGSAGSTVEFVDELGDATQPASLIFLDPESRKQGEIGALAALVGEGGRVVILGDSLEDDELVRLLKNSPLDHLISDETVPDENELVVTTGKLLSGDLFGLEKYLSWGSAIHELDVGTFNEKRAAIAAVAKYAEAVGARRATVTKIEGATDELLMNALYDAPAASSGVRTARGTGPLTDEAISTQLLDPNGGRAKVRYACDGRYFAVSVLDVYGALHKQVILDSLLRARFEKGQPKTDPTGGAGLGLYFVLSTVTRFIANIEPGRRTEVVCLFDLRQQGRDATSCARSLHVFTSPSTSAGDTGTGSTGTGDAA